MDGAWEKFGYAHPYLALRVVAHWCWAQREDRGTVIKMLEEIALLDVVITYITKNTSNYYFENKYLITRKTTVNLRKALVERVVKETRPVRIVARTRDLFLAVAVYGEKPHTDIHYRALQKLVKEGLLEKVGKTYMPAKNYRAWNYRKQIFRQSKGNTPMQTTAAPDFSYDIRKIFNYTTGQNYEYPQEEYRGFCPFHHGDHQYSFSMNNNGKFYCHQCGASGGSVVDYAVQLDLALEDDQEEDTEFRALNFLYQFSSYVKDVELSVLEPYQKEQQELDEKRYQLNLEASQRYAVGIFQDGTACTDFSQPFTPSHGYLWQRGFLSETLEHFHVAIWNLFPEHPIFLPAMLDGQAYGYVQRSFDGAWPKYLTMPTMKKTEHVYGTHSHEQMGIGLVTEGLLDQYMCWQYGWQKHGLYSILGKDTSDQQMKELAAHCTVLLAGFDNDEAGNAAYEQLKRKAKQYHLLVLRPLWVAKDPANCTEAEFWQALQPCLEEARLLGFFENW